MASSSFSLAHVPFFFFAIALLCLHRMPTTTTAQNILYTGDSLFSGQSLVSGSYQFTMQSDCNLVLYGNGIPLWSSRTSGRGTGCFVTMQADGNLVVYTGARVPVWGSNTSIGNGYYVCILQRDRNVVIYGGARWATGTNINGSPAVTISQVIAGKNDTVQDEVN